MATGTRLRQDFVKGTLTTALANEAGPSTMDSAALADLQAIDHAANNHYAVIVVNKEILHVTAHTAGATTATVQRGQEGTATAAHDAGAAWHHGPTEDDFSELASAAAQGGLFAHNQVGGIDVGTAPPLVEGWGILADITTTRTAQDEGVTTNGRYVSIGTSTTAGNTATWNSKIATVRSAFPKVLTRLSTNQLTGCVVRAGLTAGTAGNMLAADDPSGPYVMVDFSTVSADTTWHFRVHDGTTATRVNTGVAVAADGVVTFIAELDATSVTCYLLDARGKQVAKHTFAVTLADNALLWFAGVRTTEAVAKSFRMFAGTLVNRLL